VSIHFLPDVNKIYSSILQLTLLFA